VVQSLNVNLVTGIENQDDAIQVYPNPVSDNLTISSKAGGKNSIKIIDARGQIIYSATLNSSKEEIISFKEFASGFYILFVDNRRFRVVKR
jgi:hypothetical protein